MTSELLNYTVLVEPDRQRLGRFVMHAVDALGGSRFEAIRLLQPAMSELHRATAADNGGVEVSLRLRDNHLLLCWLTDSHRVASLPTCPDETRINELARKLRLETEISDPSLLKLRNQEIAAELERLTERAADQMRSMEAVLEGKRVELEETMRQAETDSLTGLLNRGAYDNRLQRAVTAAHETGKPTCLILMDLDFFKQVNDTKGHQYGDRHLQRMAEGMRSAIRENVDIPCRMGGDEFALICFCELQIAERIAQRVLDHMDQQVSIGIACCRPDDTVESLVERADECLYRAKGQGRNQYATDQSPDQEAVNA